MIGIKGQKADRATNLEAHRGEVNPSNFSMTLPQCVTPSPRRRSRFIRGSELTRTQAVEREADQGGSQLVGSKYKLPGEHREYQTLDRTEDRKRTHPRVVNPQ